MGVTPSLVREMILMTASPQATDVAKDSKGWPRRVRNHKVDGPVWEVRGSEVQVGDRLMFLGREYTVDRIEPFGPTKIPEIIGPGTRVAVSLPDWEMTLTPSGIYRIRPRHVGSV